VLLQRLELAKPEVFWDATGKMIKIFRVVAPRWHGTCKNPTFTYDHVWICMVWQHWQPQSCSFVVFNQLLPSHFKAFLRAPVFHDFTNTHKKLIRTGTYPTVNQHSY
jgi:hypothetical protein